MQSKNIRTPLVINLVFLALLLLPVIFFMIGRVSASASPLERYCERQFQAYRFGPLLPVAKKCDKIFERKVNAWISGDYSNY